MGKTWKWEIHSHTRQSSKCGWLDAAESVRLHREHGYDGMVITDHYNNENIARFYGTPLEQAQAWTGGWRVARAAAEGTGFTVLFGLEARLQDCDNDYLIFGVEPEFVLENPRLNHLSRRELHALCRAWNAVLIQAHPSRTKCTPADPEDVDGYEVYNGSVRHENHSDQTKALADAHPELIQTSGSDFHRPGDVDRGGILTFDEIHTSAELAECLRLRRFERIEKA